MSFLTPVRCYTCRKVIMVNKFLRAVEDQKDKDKIDYEHIFDKTFENKLLPCCKPRYMNILSNIQKEEILVSYDNT